MRKVKLQDGFISYLTDFKLAVVGARLCTKCFLWLWIFLRNCLGEVLQTFLFDSAVVVDCFSIVLCSCHMWFWMSDCRNWLICFVILFWYPKADKCRTSNFSAFNCFQCCFVAWKRGLMWKNSMLCLVIINSVLFMCLDPNQGFHWKCDFILN